MTLLKSVTIYYLEILDPRDFKPASCQDPDFRVKECIVKQVPLNRFLYEFVGEPWHWTDKSHWTDKDWKSYVEDANLRTWIAYKDGILAGYYELQRQEGGDIEIRYLGLAPAFIGKGYGNHLISHAIQSAWDWGASRVWVHTCSLDHPSALSNYQARGFQLYRTELKGPEIES